MDVRRGYKPTEVGVLPEDWNTPELGSVLKSMQLGGNYKNSERETRWPLIKMGNLSRGNIKLDKLEFIDTSQPPSSRDRLQKDDVLFNTRNTLDLVGKVAVWREELLEAYFNSNIMRIDFDETQVSSKRFMNYILNTPQSLRSLREIAIGTTSVAAIYSRDLVKVKVPLPTRTEQEAIAGALSEVDALVESLEQLLVKKRQIKRGALGNLLTGKKRLPGFGGKWEVKRLGETCHITTGKKDVNEGNPDGQYPFFTCARSHTYSDSYSFDTEAILIAGNGDVGNLHYFNGKFEAYQRTYILSDFSATVAYLWQQFTAYLAGSLGLGKIGSSIPYIKKENLVGFSFHSPQDEAEQAAIASILSDMDAEVSALEVKLAKARQIKQGMMQELLTGRIRLI